MGVAIPVMEAGKLVEVSTVKVSVLWPAMAYIVLTFGEVLLYGTMLELAYAAAPNARADVNRRPSQESQVIANQSLRTNPARRGRRDPPRYFSRNIRISWSCSGLTR